MKRYWHARGQSGDTIVEVVIALTIIAVVLASASVLANRNTKVMQTTQEHASGLRIAQSQLEQLKVYIAAHANEIDDAASRIRLATGFCFGKEVIGGETVFTPVSMTDPKCAVDLSGDATTGVPRYDTIIRPTVDSNGYGAQIVTSWDTLSGGRDRVTLTYRTHKKLAPTVAVKVQCPPGQVGTYPECHTPCPVGTIGTYQPYCVTPPPPVQFTVSHTAYGFASWHLANSGGAKPQGTITVRNNAPAGGGKANVGTASLADATSSFSVISNGCTNAVLEPQTGCNIVLQFNPPSGAAYNRYSNQYVRQATFTINGGTGSSARSVTLSGKTYSDRLGPGDAIVGNNEGPVPYYGASCISNIESCGMSPFTGIATNGNLYIGGTYCLWGGWGAPYPDYPGAGASFAMQTDGNLVFYGIGGVYRYASWTMGSSNYWLQVFNNGAVYITNGSSGSLVKYIHSGGTCFAW